MGDSLGRNYNAMTLGNQGIEGHINIFATVLGAKKQTLPRTNHINDEKEQSVGWNQNKPWRRQVGLSPHSPRYLD